MNEELITRVLIQLEPELAQELGCELAKILNELKTLQIINNCNNNCPDNDKVIRLSSYDRPTPLGGKKLHLDFLVIGKDCFVISPEERDILREGLHCE